MVGDMKGYRGAAALLAALIPVYAGAQAFPVKPMRIVIGFPPGGGTDSVARLVAPRMSELLGQPIVIDNRPGADTNIATEYVARASADGYTLLMNTGIFAINMSTHDKPGYDAVRDFAPVSLIATSPHILVVGPSLQVKTLKELLDTARARPGQLNYSHAGGPQYMGFELFKLRTKTDIVAVPYKGGGPAMTALIGGEVHLSFANIPTSTPHIKAGRVRVLELAGSARSVLMPDVPTMKEQGVDMQSQVWYGMLAPGAVPKRILARIAETAIKAATAEDVKPKLISMGAEPVASAPEAFAAQIRAEVKQWAEVVRLIGLKPN
jgi:tripartite-type tricarboxylate transporter receptor subunit TctC